MAGPGDVQNIHVQHLLNVLSHRLIWTEGWLSVELGRWLAAGQGQEEQGDAHAVGDAQAVVGDVHAVMGDVLCFRKAGDELMIADSVPSIL